MSASTSFTILLTSAKEDSEYFLEQAAEEDVETIHLPLEKYVPVETDHEKLVDGLESAENIIYGHKRNAVFFLQHVHNTDFMEIVTDRVNLTTDPRAADVLEEHGIPAIYPGSPEPIKMLEFLMRLRRLGPVFYPCGAQKQEEVPGLLTELEIEVDEQIFYEMEGPSEEELELHQNQVANNDIGVVIFHSRRSVNRTLAAFPDLKKTSPTIVAGDKAVAQKLLDDHEIEADRTAEGDWESIFKQLKGL